MADVPIDTFIDVSVSLGTQPIETASFNSAAFLADLLDADFASPYQIYASLTEVLDDFASTTDVYKYAALVFGGLFPVTNLYVVKYGSGNTIPLTALQALSSLRQTDSTPYWIACDDHTESTVTALAGYCEAEDLMFGNSTQQAGVLVDATTTDIGSVLQDLGYNHTFTIYNTTADTSFAEGGVAGCMAGIQAGTSSAEYKTMTGVAVSGLTTTQRTSCDNKNVMYYERSSGVNVLLNTKVSSGQFLDTVLFADWLKARIQEQLFGLLKRESDLGRKISYDESGFAQVRQSINAVINVGINNGSISTDIQPVVRTPNRQDILDADRTNRILPDVIVEVLYSNAIHKVLVRAYVTV